MGGPWSTVREREPDPKDFKNLYRFFVFPRSTFHVPRSMASRIYTDFFMFFFNLPYYTDFLCFHGPRSTFRVPWLQEFIPIFLCFFLTSRIIPIFCVSTVHVPRSAFHGFKNLYRFFYV